jgi:hypothetical protein
MPRHRKSHKPVEEDVKPLILITSYHIGGGAYRHTEDRFLSERQAAHHVASLIDGRTYTIGKRISEHDELTTDDEKIRIYEAGDNALRSLLKMNVGPHDYPPRPSVHYLLKGPIAYVPKKGSYQGEDDDVLPERKQRSSRSERTPRERKPAKSKERVDVEGLTSANAIAEELGVPGSAVRSVIRSLNLEKVNGGWWFDDDTAAKIKKKVKAKLK